MRPFNRFVALTAFTALPAYAQDISGDSQGTLKAGAQELRILLHIAKSDNGEWRATMLSTDQSPDRECIEPTTTSQRQSAGMGKHKRVTSGERRGHDRVIEPKGESKDDALLEVCSYTDACAGLNARGG